MNVIPPIDGCAPASPTRRRLQGLYSPRRPVAHQALRLAASLWRDATGDGDRLILSAGYRRRAADIAG